MRRPAAPAVLTFLAVAGAVGIVLSQLHPSLLLATTTTTGGDTGAHFATAAYLKSQLLPHGHITGWDPGWYDGFPLYTFYFPLPDLFAAVLGYIIPFTVAFKLATVLGSLTLPVAMWAFGRLAGLERPRPAILACASLPFLFDQTFTIYGGNIYSTMAGEYAFSLGLSVAFVFLGVVYRGLRTGRLRVPAALLLAACMLCHLVTAMFALAGAGVLFLLARPTRARLWWMVSGVGTGLLLVAWWAVPFALENAYSTTMGWVNVHTWVQLLAPGGTSWWLGGNRWVLAMAAGATMVGLARRSKPVIMLAVLAVMSLAAVMLDPQGQLYNTRFVPLWWVCNYALAGSFFADLVIGAAGLWREARLRWWWSSLLSAAAPPAPGPTLAMAGGAGFGPVPLPGPSGLSAALDVTATAGPEPEARPGPGPGGRAGPPLRPRRRWAPAAVAGPALGLLASAAVVLPPVMPSVNFLHVTASSVPSWTTWNYQGYERKGSWPEYQAIMRLMASAGKRYGCGRAFWEYNSSEDRFGTPMALMLMPYWTNGCINTQEGLLFESASSTPYHFIDQSELSEAPSDAMASLPYAGTNLALGVAHLQMMGVKYLLECSPALETQADADPQLTNIGSTGPWHSTYAGATDVTWELYLVHNAALVSPLTDQPQVATGVSAAQGQPAQDGHPATGWLFSLAMPWYMDEAAWDTVLTAGGPASWHRTTTVATGAPVPEPAVTVSHIRTTSSSISFHVSRTGVPVVVKVSYFPAWHATGATGPWRSTPNLMVVVPTSHNVTLTYGATPASRLGDILAVVGLVGLGLLLRRRRGRAVS